MSRFPKVGEPVIYHDPKNVPHAALLTTVWGQEANWKPGHDIPCVNLVWVSSDSARQDQYGRQLERLTSIVHKSRQSAPGNYFRFPDEAPIECGAVCQS